MKGLEGKADLDQNKKITNGELLTYMDENVSQKAAELGTKVILKEISKSVLKVIMMAKLEQILIIE